LDVGSVATAQRLQRQVTRAERASQGKARQIPSRDGFDEPSAGCLDLRLAVENPPVQLDPPQLVPYPVSQIAEPARVHPGPLLPVIPVHPAPCGGPLKDWERRA